MWSYYGSKTNVVDYYPKPLFGSIVEPFAGSARYSLKYFDRDITLIDKYKVITDIWDWLKLASPADVLSLPRIKKGETLNDYVFDDNAQKLLLGFIIQFGVATPGLSPSPQKMDNRSNFIDYTLKRISENIFKIRHWKIINGEYSDQENIQATWFIDPPYQFGGHKYRWSNKRIDFLKLADWCKSLSGQQIVCENDKANWLPFINLSSFHGTKGMSNEVFYTNVPTSYGVEQLKLL